MFKRALIAVDIHSQVPLLDLIPDLANWGIEELTLLHLIQTSYGVGPLPGQSDDYQQGLNQTAKRLRTDGFKVEAVVETVPDTGDAIVNYATEFDLVVIGTRSLNFVEDFFLGSVVRTVLRKTTVPVLLEWVEVIEESDGPDVEQRRGETLKRVVLATDLAHGSTAAHEAAIELAGKGARVDCVHVAQSDQLSDFVDGETMVRSVLEGLVERIEGAGGSGEAVVVEGETVPRLLEAATERGATLFVVGKSGREWPKSLLGTTAQKLCERAMIPVLLVPRPPE